MLIPSSAPLSAHHPVTPTPCSPPLPLPLVYFPIRCFSCFVTLTDIFTHFLSFPFIPLHYFLYSPNEWDHIMFVLLWLTYFTQHHTLQFHPRRSKWWLIVISNGWGIFHCIHRPHLLIHSSFHRHQGSFHSLAIVDIAARNIGVQVSRRFIASVSLG